MTETATKKEMSYSDFYKKHKEFLHETIDVMFDEDRKVLEWFDLRTDNQILIVGYFTAQLQSVVRFWTIAMLQQILTRKMDLSAHIDPNEL